VVDIEPKIAWNFTWAVLRMEDDNFWHLGGVTRWNSQILIHIWTSLAINFVASQSFLCLFWTSLWFWIGVYNTLLQKLCEIDEASKNSNSNAQHFLSDLVTHSWFHSILFALPGYQFPYIVMNRCLYLILIWVCTWGRGPGINKILFEIILCLFSQHNMLNLMTSCEIVPLILLEWNIW
jgi:hypothetical protein